jgi:hypothetical protein
MAGKRRVLKWGAAGLLVFLFILWFGFTTFLFNPLEDDYEYDVSTLIPRNVDFYVAKAGLAGDLDSDLELRVAGELAENPRLQAITRLPAYQELASKVDLAAVRKEVQESLAQLPVKVDPLQIFGGRDVALAGTFRGPGDGAGPGGAIEWGVYGRANWMGKLGVSLLAYPNLLKLDQQGIAVEEVRSADGSERIAYLLSGGRLTRPLYVHRLQDVVALGTDPELFRQMPVLARQRGQDSFGQSARYEDRINVAGRDPDELELFLDYRALAEQRGFTGRWPDSTSDAFGTALAGRLFQSGSLNDAIGRMRFGRVLALDLHGTLSSELMTAVQKRLYRHRGIDKETLLSDVASMIPADAGLFVYGVGDLGDLVREALSSSEDAFVTNLEDLVRSVWSYSDVQPLVDDLDAAFGDRFAFCVRKNDYTAREDDPPHDDTVVPAWALVLWVEDEARVKALRDTVSANQGSFGIHGREPGTPGVFYHELSGGGQLVFEYWSPLIPGTGHMSTVTDVISGGTVFVISNHFSLCGQMLNTFRHAAAGGFPQLAEQPTFSTQVTAALPSANLVLWVNAGQMGDTLRGMAKRWASDKVQIDWDVERPRIEKKVLKEKMPDAVWGKLTPQQEEELAMLSQPEKDAFEADFRSQHASKFELEFREQIEALEALDGVLLEVALDKADLDLALRVRLPLE